MPEPRRIVAEVRAQLASIGESGAPSSDDDALSDLAASYAEACGEANARLRRCAEYLERGLRGEAVHLAQCPPDLLETTRALDFPDRKEWAKLCAARRLAVPAPPATEVVPAIEAAMKVDREMEALVSSHRLLALAREPVPERLAVLRRLRERDKADPWSGQITELEAIRLRQMRDEAKAAFRGRDATAIESLYLEVSKTPWLGTPPADLRGVLTRAYDLLRVEAMSGELRGLISTMKSARETGDYAKAVETLSRWQGLVTDRQITVPDDLLEETRAVSAWVAGEERRRGVKEKLQSIQPVLQAGERAARRRVPLLLVRNAIVLAALAAGIAAVAYWILRHSPT